MNDVSGGVGFLHVDVLVDHLAVVGEDGVLSSVSFGVLNKQLVDLVQLFVLLVLVVAVSVSREVVA